MNVENIDIIESEKKLCKTITPLQGWDELENGIIRKIRAHKNTRRFSPFHILQSWYGLLIEVVVGLLISGVLGSVFIQRHTGYTLSGYVQMLRMVGR